jgi:hypothetical protein
MAVKEEVITTNDVARLTVKSHRKLVYQSQAAGKAIFTMNLGRRVY